METNEQIEDIERTVRSTNLPVLDLFIRIAESPGRIMFVGGRDGKIIARLHELGWVKMAGKIDGKTRWTVNLDLIGGKNFNLMKQLIGFKS